jgi:hypothetical protein
MLREIRNVAPGADGERRRWFTSDYFDLFLFYGPNHVKGFQLCYDKPGVEHALTWDGGASFRHHCVDQGDGRPTRNQAAIFGAALRAFQEGVVARFREESESIDPQVRGLMLDRLDEYVRIVEKS